MKEIIGVCAALAALVTETGAYAQAVEPLFKADDYPAGAMRRMEQGTVVYHLVIGVDGKVKSCRVTISSGSKDLDKATCRILKERARYKPALDSNGEPIESRVDDKTEWRLWG